MKKQSTVLFACALLYGSFANAANFNPIEHVKKITPRFIYTYIDFDFDSTVGSNFNRYQGFSNTYTGGGDKNFNEYKAAAGIYVINTDTHIHSQFSIEPNIINNAKRSINNTTVFAHVRKMVKDPIDIDILGGYGHSNVTSQAWINADIAESGFSNPNDSNWFVGANLNYNKNWNKLNFSLNIGALYSEVNTNAYLLRYPTAGYVSAPKFKNDVTYISQEAQIGYTVNSEFAPFFNAGLIQVAGFKNTPETLIIPVTGFLPQFNMDKNGFRLGAGFNFSRKNFTVKLEEKYYNAGNTFISYQTLAALIYQFS